MFILTFNLLNYIGKLNQNFSHVQFLVLSNQLEGG
jgi:hypothetical protein